MKLTKIAIATAFVAANIFATSAAVAQARPAPVSICDVECGTSVECWIAQALLCWRHVPG